jgi:hypothetical protein
VIAPEAATLLGVIAPKASVKVGVVPPELIPETPLVFAIDIEVIPEDPGAQLAT